jgi:hypothetical protein
MISDEIHMYLANIIHYEDPRPGWLKQEHLIAEIKRYETSPMYEGFPFAAVYAIIRSGDQEHLIQLLLNLDDPFSFSWDELAFLSKHPPRRSLRLARKRFAQEVAHMTHAPMLEFEDGHPMGAR